MTGWSAHVVRRKEGHVAVVLVLDLPLLAGEQVGREVAAEALAAVTERPALVELLRQAPTRSDFRLPS